MRDGLDAARALLPGVRLDAASPLGGSDRSAVQRVRARGTQSGDSSLIVKQFHAGGEGWVRECAALLTIAGAVGTPLLVAAGPEPPVAVIADLGRGPTLADALLGDDPDQAGAMLIAWAQTVAALHSSTKDSRPAFRAALDARAGELTVHDALLGNDIDNAVRVLDQACGVMSVAVPSGAFDELRGLHHRLGGDGPSAITPADVCPDNNVFVDGRLALIDFENAQWRNVTWDLAYLRVPWPSCRCSWRLPSWVADRAVTAYRQAAADAFPQVGDDAFERDLDAAATGLAMMSVSWFLDNALGEEPPPSDADDRSPVRRAVVRHRLAEAGRSTELPALAELGRRLNATLEARWGEIPLALAPAFR